MIDFAHPTDVQCTLSSQLRASGVGVSSRDKPVSECAQPAFLMKSILLWVPELD